MHRRLTCLAVFALAAGCRPEPGSPPPVSFLVVAGDSTIWVESEGPRFTLRRSPLLLTRIDGRFHELYVSDDDRSYANALLVGQRIYRRDLITGDSVLVRFDSSVAVLADEYAARHPHERPLAPDEETSDDPSTQATTDTELLDVIGPYLSFEFHLDIDIHGERDQHVTQRGVVDSRTGQRVRVEDLVPPDDAIRAYNEGQARFAAALDSIRRAKDERASRAQPLISGFTFDSSSFELLEGESGPAIAFLVPGRGPRAGGYALPLGEIPIARVAWWDEIARALPTRDEHDQGLWADSAYDIAVTADSGGATASVEVRAEGGHWPAATVPLPVRRIFRLGTTPVDTLTRRALLRAFDEAAAYSGATRAAANRNQLPFSWRLRRAARAHMIPPWKPGLHTTARRSSPIS